MLAFFIALVVILLIVAGIAVRIIMLPGGEFRGTCGTNTPFNQREGGKCQVCGKSADEACPNDNRQEVIGQQ